MSINAPTIKQVYWVEDKATGTLKRIQKEQGKTAGSMGVTDKKSKVLTKSLGGLAAGLTAVAVAGASLKFLKDSVVTFAKFEAQMNKTRAVSGASADEMQRLTEQAKELGANTALSASNVGELQFELSKLGFTVDQITESTGDVGNLSLALGHDLADSASIAGKTLRQFGLEANEMGRVVDNIAQGASSSALDITSFSEAMKFAGGTAGQLGFDIEETTAAIGQLSNVGISGTLAGTGLNRILLDLTNSSSKASKYLKGFKGEADDLVGMFRHLNRQGLTANEVFDIFGKIAGKSALALIRNADAMGDLEGKMRDANGRAEDMTKIMQEGLVGQWTQLKSASEGLKINIGEAFGPATIAGIKKATGFIRDMTDAVTFFRAMLGQNGMLGSPKDIMKNEQALGQVISKIEYINSLIAQRDRERGKGVLRRDDDVIKNLNAQVKAQDKALKLMTSQSRTEFDLGTLRAQEAKLRAKRLKDEEKSLELAKKKKELEKEVGAVAKPQSDKDDKEAERIAKEAERKRLAIIASGLAQEKAMKQAQLDFEDEAVDQQVQEWKEAVEKKRKIRESYDINRIQKEGEFAVLMQDAQAKDLEDFKAAEQIKRDERMATAQAAVTSFNAIGSAFSQLAGMEISKINEKAQADIDAVNNRDKKLTAAEKRKEKEIKAIKFRAAQDAHGLREAQWAADGLSLASTGALAIIRATADLGIVGGVLAGAAVAANTAVWAANKPEPPKLATGAFVQGSQQGAQVIVGEKGNDEEIFGMGSKGVPRRSKFASEVAEMVGSRGGSNISVTVNEAATPQLTAIAVVEALEEAQLTGMVRS